MTPVDRRVRRTRHSLREALLALILEKGYDAITIRDITERADIAYATFFRHYDGKDDLLAEQIGLLMDEFESRAKQQSGPYFLQEGQILFEYLQDHFELFQRLVDARTSRRVFRKLKQKMIEIIQQNASTLYATATDPQIPFEILVNHTASATLELVIWWLENRMPYDPLKMAQIFEQLIVKASWWSAGIQIEHDI